MSDSPYLRSGTSVPVMPNVLQRLRQHSPEVAAFAQAYLNARPGEHERVTYGGSDASAELTFHIIEGLACFEQLRLEVNDQIEQHTTRCEDIPPAFFILMSQLLALEPVLIQSAKSAVRLHGSLWKQGLKEKKKKKKRKKKEN